MKKIYVRLKSELVLMRINSLKQYSTGTFGIVVVGVKETLVNEHKRKDYFKKSALQQQACLLKCGECTFIIKSGTQQVKGELRPEGDQRAVRRADTGCRGNHRGSTVRNTEARDLRLSVCATEASGSENQKLSSQTSWARPRSEWRVLVLGKQFACSTAAFLQLLKMFQSERDKAEGCCVSANPGNALGFRGAERIRPTLPGQPRSQELH